MVILVMLGGLRGRFSLLPLLYTYAATGLMYWEFSIVLALVVKGTVLRGLSALFPLVPVPLLLFTYLMLALAKPGSDFFRSFPRLYSKFIFFGDGLS